jgi:hypothetical protein
VKSVRRLSLTASPASVSRLRKNVRALKQQKLMGLHGYYMDTSLLCYCHSTGNLMALELMLQWVLHLISHKSHEALH